MGIGNQNEARFEQRVRNVLETEQTEGPQGIAGIAGPTGPTGPAGPTGPTGPTGSAGGTGAVGATGPTGATGGAGATGATGTAGSAGVAGSKLYSGFGAPSSGTGVVGDWYINRTNGDVYEKTGSTTWTVRSNFKGPTGEVGGPAQVLAYYAYPPSVAVYGTVSGTELCTLTIPANTMQVPSICVMQVWGEWQNITGLTKARPIFELDFSGGTVVHTIALGSSSVGTMGGTNKSPWSITIYFMNTVNTSTQEVTVECMVGGVPSYSGAYSYAPGGSTYVEHGRFATGTFNLDTTGDVPIKLNVYNGDPSGFYGTEMYFALLYLYATIAP